MKALIGLVLGISLGFVTTLLFAEKPVEAISIELELPDPEPRSILSEKEIGCLARTIYGEARGEPDIGQVLIGFSVIDRTLDSRWPGDACDVVRQKSQFSGYWKANMKDKASVEESYRLARISAEEYWNAPKQLKGLFYFTSAKEPSKFHRSKRKIVTIGNHTFYGDENASRN